MNRHIVLLGDSIFDNALYVPGGPSVLEHVRRILPRGDYATLIAVDGATVSTVFRQIERIPDNATHLVLSVGGNDALWMSGNIFSQRVDDVRASLEHVSELVAEFAVEYQRLVAELRQRQLPMVTCTIYDSIPGLERAEIAGLCVFNDNISRTAIQCGTTLIDLRTICDESSDFSSVSPIEPSAFGGGKIARAIMEATSDCGHFHRVVG